ncbi:MAG: BamA/TamA family outer membrane protein [Bdellovibrionales bacterium]|nr:BamA/TamA family outer membrane protein [Bdellovibrionales bacterium]
MSLKRLVVPFFTTVLASLSACSSPELCGTRVQWAPGSERVELGKNDEIFVCGDSNHASWQNVPPRQSAAYLRSFLESKGYLDPKIDVDYDASRVTVNAGRRATIAVILSEGDPPGWTNAPLETNLGRPLEKAALDQIQNDATGLLRAMGYACGDVKLEAHPDGRIVLKIDSGTPKSYPAPVSMGDYPISDAIFSRYEPFSPGDPFDARELTLAGRRIESEVASSASYSTVCAKDKLDRLERTAGFGPRRSWEIGAGASTEEYPLAFIRWKTNRLWSSASNFQIELFGSNKRQELEFELKHYAFRSSPRVYLRPVFDISHKNEDQYETLETKAAVYLGRAIDVGYWTIEPEIGYSASKIRDVDFNPPRDFNLLTPEVNLGAHSHDFELYGGDPRSGLDVNSTYRYLPGSQATSIGIHRVFVQGTALVNYRSYLEPRWVLGARYSFGTLFTTDGTVPDPQKLPRDWFFLGGGDRDLRGFGRATLPSEEQGAGSLATVGFESRWPHLLPIPLEPLVFYDVGWVGAGNAKFDPAPYLSPGFGVRSPTPIGTIRGTLARGISPARGIHRWQLFLSFGTEF